MAQGSAKIAKMAKLEPRWSQHGEARSGQDGRVGAKMAQESAKMEPRWPSWSQDGSKMAQESAKMAKLEPRRSQHGSKMAQDAPTWAGIGAQHGLRLRITAPVNRISPSGAVQVCVTKQSVWALGHVCINKE